MDEQTLLQGLGELEKLSREDYHEPLGDILHGALPAQNADRLARLIGVTLKTPFAHPENLPAPSFHTQSWRGWELDPKRFEERTTHDTWQYRTLEALRQEPENILRFGSLRELAEDANFERGFFGYLARSTEKYICGDPKLRKAIDESVENGKAAGLDLRITSPEKLVQGGGVALASILITHIPILGLVGAPVIAGFVLLIYTIGVDAFCAWVKSTSASTERT